MASTRKRKSSKATKRPATFAGQFKFPAIKPQAYAVRINGFLNNVNTYVKTRSNRFGGSDPVAKKLSKATTSAKGQLRKKNIVNPGMAKSLTMINASLRGVSNIPKSIRMNYRKLLRFLRDHVRGHVVSTIGTVQKSISSMNRDATQLQNQLERQIKKAKGKNIQYKVDPAIKQKFNALNRRIASFKTKWYKKFNPLATHGNRQIASALKSLKKEIDSLQKCVRQNISLINRATKKRAAKKGVKTQVLIPKSVGTALHRSWERYEKGLSKNGTQFGQLLEQLKATKAF